MKKDKRNDEENALLNIRSEKEEKYTSRECEEINVTLRRSLNLVTVYLVISLNRQ